MSADDEIRQTAESFFGEYGEPEDVERVLARLEWRRRRGRKECSACGEALPTSSFGPDTRRKDGLRSACRPCEAGRSRSRRAVV